MYKDRSLFSRALHILVLGTTVEATQVQKRDSSLQTLQIPLLLDQNQYFVDVTMSSGSGEQAFKLAVSTGTGYTVVAGTNCSSCNSSGSYNVSKSTTVQQLGLGQNVSLLGTAATGALVREDCHLTQSNGSTWVYNNQTLIVANQTQSNMLSGISGIVGLGTNARNGDFESTIYSQWLSQHPGVSNFTFGMMLNPPTPESQSDGGVLHWLAPETTAYQGDVAWKELTAFDPTAVNSNIWTETDWFIGLDSWSSTSGSGSTVSKTGGNMVAVIEPFSPNIIFPQNAANMIYNNVQGAQLLTSSSTPTNQWSIPCDSKMELTLTFDSLDITLKEDTLIRQQPGNICIGTVEQWSDSSATEFFLGSSFISAVYIIWSISAANGSSIGLARRRSDGNSQNRFSGGVIAGIVLGGLAFVLLLLVTIILVKETCKKRRQKDLKANSNHHATQRLQHIRLPSSVRNAANGFTAEEQYIPYYDSTPMSPSYPLTPPTPPDHHREQDIFLSSITPPITPPTESSWDPLGPRGYTAADGSPNKKSRHNPQRSQDRVLVYTRPVPVDDSDLFTSPPSISGHAVAGGSETEPSIDGTRMNVRTGRIRLDSQPPAYGQWEASTQGTQGDQLASTGEGSSVQQSGPRKEKKKKKIVMAR